MTDEVFKEKLNWPVSILKSINQILKKPFLSNQQSNNPEFGTSKVSREVPMV